MFIVDDKGAGIRVQAEDEHELEDVLHFLHKGMVNTPEDEPRGEDDGMLGLVRPNDLQSLIDEIVHNATCKPGCEEYTDADDVLSTYVYREEDDPDPEKSCMTFDELKEYAAKNWN